MKYEKYKNSGIEWLGEVPEHWELCKIKHKYGFKTGATPSSGKKEFYEGHLRWANIGDIDNEIIFDTNNHITQEAVNSCNMTISPKGSLLYSFKLSVGQVAFCGEDMYTNEAIATFESRKQNLKYLYYIAPQFIIHNANRNIYNAPLLNQDLIKNAVIILPPKKEQDKIVAYLDEKCGKINGAIDVQKKKIDLLNELKQTIITNAVTKGLNPDAPMKDSGVEWIGQVPEHWEVMKLKRCSTIKTGCTPPTSETKYYDSEDINWYTPVDIGGNKLFEAEKKISSISKIDGVCRIFPERSIYFVGIGATIGKVSYCDEEASSNQQINAIMPNKRANYKFLTYVLKSQKDEIYLTANTVTLPIINQDRTGSLFCPIPSIEEQTQIVQFIETKTERIDAQISKANRRIELLSELKQSIITEAVTGKIKVC